MRRDEPGWWYDEQARLVPALLSPLSFVYGAIASARLKRLPGYRSTLPVICVGNFTVGGSGKTPFVAYLCETLAARGRKPAILTRGYGGRERGPVWVGPHHLATDVGDEAILLARVAPTLVARDRARGAASIEADARGFDVIVMDDGFQNRSLAKTLSVVLVGAARGLGNGAPLPSGPLRAPLAVQARFADAVVVVDAAAADRNARDRFTAELSRIVGKPLFQATVEPVPAGLGLGGEPVIAYCGIAGPERFFATVEALGAVLVERCAFRDHQAMTAREAADLLAVARERGAKLVTTEKDMARLSGESGELGTLRTASVAVPIRVTLDTNEEKRLWSLIDDALEGPR